MDVGILSILILFFKKSYSGCVGPWYFCVLFGICKSSRAIWMKFCIIISLIFILHISGVAASTIMSQNVRFFIKLIFSIWHKLVN